MTFSIAESELEKKIQELKPWFQNITLGKFQTRSEKEFSQKQWEIFESYIPKDLKGKKVLELACNAGFFSLNMKKRGAEVVGVDQSPKYLEQAKFVAQYNDFKIDYRLQNIYDFVLNNKELFDYVIFFGVFYHLRYPLLVFDRLAEFTKEKLFFHTVIKNHPSATIRYGKPQMNDKKKFIIPEDISRTEKEIYHHPDFPQAYFIEKKMGDDLGNWWVYNDACIRAMLRSSGFRNVESLPYNIFVCDGQKLKNKTHHDYTWTDLSWIGREK